MSLSWQDVSLCETTIGVDFAPLHGDLDVNGHVGVSDLFLVLEELGCMGHAMQTWTTTTWASST